MKIAQMSIFTDQPLHSPAVQIFLYLHYIVFVFVLHHVRWNLGDIWISVLQVYRYIPLMFRFFVFAFISWLYLCYIMT